MPSACALAVVSCGRAERSRAGRRVRSAARPRREFAPPSVARRARRPCVRAPPEPPFALTAKSASLGARLTAFSSRLKYASAAGPVSEIGVFAVVGSCQDLGEAPARDPQARRPGGDHDGRGDHLRGAPLSGGDEATVTFGASTRTGSATGARVTTPGHGRPSAGRPCGRARGRSRLPRSRCAARAGPASPRGAERRSPSRRARARRSTPRCRRARAARGLPGTLRAPAGGSRGRSRSRLPAARPWRRRRPSRPRRRAPSASR